jgi:hypothetical protein
MVPPDKLTPKILAALGFLGCTQTSICLSVAPCLSPVPADIAERLEDS